MKTVKQIRTKIASLQRRLQNKSVVENFGLKESYELNDFIGDIWSYPYFERNIIMTARSLFNEWCMNYEGKK